MENKKQNRINFLQKHIANLEFLAKNSNNSTQINQEELIKYKEELFELENPAKPSRVTPNPDRKIEVVTQAGEKLEGYYEAGDFIEDDNKLTAWMIFTMIICPFLIPFYLLSNDSKGKVIEFNESYIKSWRYLKQS